MRHEVQKTSLCALSVVVLLGVAGECVPCTKQAFLKVRKPECENKKLIAG